MPCRSRPVAAPIDDFEDAHLYKGLGDVCAGLVAESGRVGQVSNRVADGRPEVQRLGWALLAGPGLLLWVLVGPLATNRAEAQEAPQAFTPDPAEACEGKEPGASCWMEIADRLGCYTWNPHLAAGETVTWSGECSGGLAQGTGSRQWSHPDDEGNPLVSGGEGELRAGRRHGPWSAYYSNGEMDEGSYEHGEPVGQWTRVFADGTVFEGEWANGQRQGRWTLTYGDDEGGGFYAAGKQHGRWKLLFAAGDNETVRGTAEGLYVAGNRNGLWVTRFDSGTVHEITWRHGVRHGPSSSRYADGAVKEGPYQEGKKHGHWTERNGSTVESGEYKQGKKHGAWTERQDSGAATTYTYTEGSIAGPYSRRDSSGALVEEGAFGCGTSFCYSEYDDNLFKTGPWEETVWWDQSYERHFEGHATGPYVDNERHGAWVLTYEDGRREEGTYRHGKKHGLWKETFDEFSETSYHEGTYVDGIREGPWTENYGSDVTNSGAYKNGDRHGIWIRRDSRSHPQISVESATFVHGRKEDYTLVLVYPPSGTRCTNASRKKVQCRGSVEIGSYERDELQYTTHWFDGTSSSSFLSSSWFDGDAGVRVRALSKLGWSAPRITVLLGIAPKKVDRALADPHADVRY